MAKLIPVRFIRLPQVMGLQVSTYNGAGPGVVPVPVLNTLDLPALFDIFGLDTGNAVTNKITNLFSDTGIEIVSDFARIFGETVGVFTEN